MGFLCGRARERTFFCFIVQSYARHLVNTSFCKNFEGVNIPEVFSFCNTNLHGTEKYFDYLRVLVIVEYVLLKFL